MDRLDEFRIYYNHTIHPELMRMERKRKNLLLLLFVSFFILVGIILLELYIDVFLVTMVMMIPLALYITFLFYQIRNFIIKFKPRVVNLVLDFIAEDNFKYVPDKTLTVADFKASRIFSSDAPSFKGEDYISGQIGEIEFEMSEIEVREFSKVRNRLNYVFKGVFLKADFSGKSKGVIYVLPEEFQQYLTRSIKQFTREGAVAVELGSEVFEEAFMVYATKDAHVHELLSLDVQAILVRYRRRMDKEIYISFLDGQMYIAVTEPKDILEPYIFQSNVSFELVREFYEDLQLLFSVIEEFDLHH